MDIELLLILLFSVLISSPVPHEFVGCPMNLGEHARLHGSPRGDVNRRTLSSSSFSIPAIPLPASPPPMPLTWISTENRRD